MKCQYCFTTKFIFFYFCTSCITTYIFGGWGMELTIIGYWGGYPARNGASSMYVLEKDGFMLVIDVGSGGLAKFQKYKSITDIDAVLLSHYHADHIADVGVLQHAVLVEYYITGSNTVVSFYSYSKAYYHYNQFIHIFI